MTTNVLHNIDDVRAEIMWLELSATFDQAAWDRVLGMLVDHPSAMADAMRRMDTARRNARFMAPAIPADAVYLHLDA